MKVEMKAYYALPCSLEVFKINEQTATAADFGNGGDQGWGEAEPVDYACGDWQFEKDEHKKTKAMKKYNITSEQWDEIADKLVKTLYVGSCGWCV